MRAMPLLLLLGMLTGLWSAPAAEAKCPLWKAGEVITAELVNLEFGQGYYTANFITPDDIHVYLMLDDGGNCLESNGAAEYPPAEREHYCAVRITPPEVIEHEGPWLEDHILDHTRLGYPMRITFQHFMGDNEDDDVWYGITASDVRLDRDPHAPRNTRIIPHRKVRGNIYCPPFKDGDDIYDDHVYFITPDARKYKLAPESPRGNMGFSEFCAVRETITLEGDFWREGTDVHIFQTAQEPREFLPAEKDAW